VAAKTNVLTIPRQALSFPRTYAQTHTINLPPAGQTSSNKGVVLVVQNGNVEARNVQLGINNNQLIEITDSLKVGELVATGQDQNRTQGNAAGTGGNASAGSNAMRSPFMPGGGGSRR